MESLIHQNFFSQRLTLVLESSSSPTSEFGPSSDVSFRTGKQGCGFSCSPLISFAENSWWWSICMLSRFTSYSSLSKSDSSNDVFLANGTQVCPFSYFPYNFFELESWWRATNSTSFLTSLSSLVNVSNYDSVGTGEQGCVFSSLPWL